MVDGYHFNFFFTVKGMINVFDAVIMYGLVVLNYCFFIVTLDFSLNFFLQCIFKDLTPNGDTIQH